MRISEICEGLGVSLETLDKHAAEIARHRREVEREAEQGLSVPVDQLSLRARREIGQDARTEDELLSLHAIRARHNALRTMRKANEKFKRRQLEQELERIAVRASM